MGNDERYKSFMDLQDQLHRNICRQRTLVAIGTHDLDSLNYDSNSDEKKSFVYDAQNPADIEFVPLTHDSTEQSFSADALLEHYSTDPSCKHLKPYVPIISDSPVYPVVMYEEDVLSLPPIINGAKSKITLETKNVLIEC